MPTDDFIQRLKEQRVAQLKSDITGVTVLLAIPVLVVGAYVARGPNPDWGTWSALWEEASWLPVFVGLSWLYTVIATNPVVGVLVDLAKSHRDPYGAAMAGAWCAFLATYFALPVLILYNPYGLHGYASIRLTFAQPQLHQFGNAIALVAFWAGVGAYLCWLLVSGLVWAFRHWRRPRPNRI
jgi:hypothetical protein